MQIPLGFESRTTLANGVELHYVAGGAGEPVLLVPGWPQTWYAWRHVMPPLAERYRVIAVDIRGMGRSEKPGSGYDVRTLAADLAALLTGLGHERCLYVGHDIGTWIGYTFAASYPDRTPRLVLMDAAVPGLFEPPPLILPPEQNKKVWHFAFNQLPDLPETLVRGRERPYLKWLFDNKAYEKQAIDELALDAYVAAYAAGGALEASYGWYRAMHENIACNRALAARKLPMPVMAIGGEHGLGAAMERSIGPACEDLVAHVIPDCGHYIPEEAPEALLELLLPFLDP